MKLFLSLFLASGLAGVPAAIGAVGSVKPTDYVFARAPMLVYWETTLSCGLTCRHCRAELPPCIPRPDRSRHPRETREC